MNFKGMFNKNLFNLYSILQQIVQFSRQIAIMIIQIESSNQAHVKSKAMKHNFTENFSDRNWCDHQNLLMNIIIFNLCTIRYVILSIIAKKNGHFFWKTTNENRSLKMKQCFYKIEFRKSFQYFRPIEMTE